MPILEKVAGEVLVEVEDQSAKMLGTIVVSRNLKALEEQLPKANYKTSIKKPASVDRTEKKEQQCNLQRRNSADKLTEKQELVIPSSKQPESNAEEETKQNAARPP
eukprot:TRINITY_DN3127_c0_g3_i8.p4 TRINITY_DN3127_c0_g3~~TRINITY_DN3127_c0_g3_i8.p4  ORF type:complete len:106 (+),score=34.31 TRINITY_DN3127_c0_g3_i8:1111-1428(+)